MNFFFSYLSFNIDLKILLSFRRKNNPHSHVSINLKTDGVLKQNGKARLTAKIMKEGQSLTNANVSFEVWQDGLQQSEYIEASESISGENQASKSFSKIRFS